MTPATPQAALEAACARLLPPNKWAGVERSLDDGLWFIRAAGEIDEETLRQIAVAARIAEPVGAAPATFSESELRSLQERLRNAEVPALAGRLTEFYTDQELNRVCVGIPDRQVDQDEQDLLPAGIVLIPNRPRRRAVGSTSAPTSP